MRSGTHATTAPLNRATRFSLRKSSFRIDPRREASSANGSIVRVPHAKPASVVRTTSVTFPAKMTRAPGTAATIASTGFVFSARAQFTARPIRHACDREWRTARALNSAPDMGAVAIPDMQPIATVVARSTFSRCLTPAHAAITTALPFSSAMAVGACGVPYRVNDSICSSGKARPIPSPSTTGNPVAAESTSGSSPLDPPISIDATQSAVTCVCASIPRTADSVSVPPGHFSDSTVGAPIKPSGKTRASSERAFKPRTRIVRPSARDRSARDRPVCTLPPPPVPRMPQPIAIASTSFAERSQSPVSMSTRTPEVSTHVPGVASPAAVAGGAALCADEVHMHTRGVAAGSA
eukprot:Opistho-1_new@79020